MAMANAIKVPVPLSKEEIRSMVDEGIVDPHVEVLRTMQSEVSRALQAEEEFPTLPQLDWVDDLEDTAAELADEMVEDAEDLRHGAAMFDGRAGEEALVSELRSQAAWCDARHAEAVALVADLRRLRDGYLRMMAGTEDEKELIESAAAGFLEFLAKEMDGGGVSDADAARADAMDAAARAGHGVGERFAATFMGLAERLRRCAEGYTGEDEAVADALRGRAAAVEALCADPEALVARMLVSAWWRFWRHLNRQAGGTQTSMPAAPTPPRPL